MIEPIIALNTATFEEKQVERQIALIADAGFSGIGLWMDVIGWDASVEKIQAISRLVAEHKLTVEEICYLKAATNTQRNYDQVEQECELLAHAASLLSCPIVVAAPAGEGEEDLSPSQFKKLKTIAGKHHVLIGLEFPATAKYFSTLERSLPLVEESGISLVVDSFHFFVGGSNLHTLEGLNKKHIGLVHLSDAEDYPYERLRKVKHDLRTYTGSGILPLTAFIETLQNIGYQGSYSTEIWNAHINADKSSHVVKEAMRTTKALFASIEK